MNSAQQREQLSKFPGGKQPREPRFVIQHFLA